MIPPLPSLVLPDPLLRSARAEFHAHGFSGANVGRIATAAGISKKTIYKYVSSKEELLYAVLLAAMAEVQSAISRDVQSEEPDQYLIQFLTHFAKLSFSDEGIAAHRIVMSEGGRWPAMANMYVNTIKTFGLQPLADRLAEYAAAGRMVIRDPMQSAIMLFTMVVADGLRDAALGLVSPPTGQDLAALIDDAVSVFLHGVSPGRG